VRRARRRLPWAVRCYPTGLDFELHVIASASAGDLDPSLNSGSCRFTRVVA
jgi:hypothetical protein